MDSGDPSQVYSDVAVSQDDESAHDGGEGDLESFTFGTKLAILSAEVQVAAPMTAPFVLATQVLVQHHGDHARPKAQVLVYKIIVD